MRRRRRRRPPSGCLMPSFRGLFAELSPTFCRSFRRVVVWVTSSSRHIIGPREELSSSRPDHPPGLQCLYFFNVCFLEIPTRFPGTLPDVKGGEKRGETLPGSQNVTLS